MQVVERHVSTRADARFAASDAAAVAAKTRYNAALSVTRRDPARRPSRGPRRDLS
jgi:hypothetical protein